MVGRWTMGLVLAVLVGFLGCSHGDGGAVAVERLVPEERAALEAVFAEAGIAATGMVFHDDLYGLPWRGAESHARLHGRQDRVDAIRKRQDDTRNAVAIAGGHVVALRLGRTRLTKLATVSRLTHLVVLDLHDSQIDDLEGLSAMVELDHLDLAGNRLASLAKLEGLPALRSLYLADNPIERVDGLDDLPKLELLNLAGARIAKIEGFAKLARLRTLSLERNPIERLEGLDANVALEDLNLSFCRISKIENLGPLANLRHLNLWHNRIVRLEGVETSTSLVYLGVGENPYDWGDLGNQEILKIWGRHRLVSTF
jgi:Leucine Rich repeats (2 copies)